MDCGCKDDAPHRSIRKSTSKLLRAKRNPESSMENNNSRDSKSVALMSPSEYIKQMLMNPEKLICNNKVCEWIESSIFTPIPKIIAIQKFSTESVYGVTLQIRNTSQVPHHLKLMSSENVNFKVTFKGVTLNTRLAPGMTLAYDVEFRPDERRDYFHSIKFKSDVGLFTVPVVAVGPRPLLSFPDQIDVGETALKVAKVKPLLMQNIGDTRAGFSIYTNNSCFTVTPKRASLSIGEAVQVQINFLPTKLGLSNGCIFLRYESGDTVQTVVYGESVKCDVQVDPSNVTMDPTYLGLSRITSIKISNNSNYLLKYKLVKNQNVEEDIQEREKCIEKIEPMKDLPRDDKILPNNVQELMCRRIYSDKLEILKNASFTYTNEHFHLFPTIGEVRPCCSTEVMVSFEPIKVEDIHTVAYLEIDGQEQRIPVSMMGKCKGPTLKLNLLSLDIQKVYLCSTYNYEIICKNEGPIPGVLTFANKKADFGSTIIVEPSEIEMKLDEIKCMRLSFSSDRTGNFIERIDFVIKESFEVLSFIMKGEVICPLMFVDLKEIKLYRAAISFTMKKEFSLHNLSHAPIDYNCTVPSDGCDPAITYEEFSRMQTRSRLPSCPREFSIHPSQGTIEPETSICLKLLYTPNIIRSCETRLQVNLCNSPNAEPLCLPISLCAETAVFHISPSDIDIRCCYINHPYCRNLTVTNSSKVDGYFYFIPQENPVDTAILYSLSTYQGHIEPGQMKELTLTIIVKEIGQQEACLSLYSLGFEEKVACSEIQCQGEGPIVIVEPLQLNWCEVRLLERHCRTLEISNDSPIAASFTASVSKNKSIWKVRPTCYELEACETISLDISVFLKDTGKYVDRLSIAVLNGETINVGLSAIGVGTSVTFSPEIFPVFNMGFLFCGQNIDIPITVKNEGSRYHHVLLTIVENLKQSKKAPVEPVENSIYKVTPKVFDLSPGSEQIIHCKTRWNSIDDVCEQWYIYATIEGQGKRELLGTSTFTAAFIEPRVFFNKCELIFRLDYGCECKMIQQEDELIITNQSCRDLTAHLTTDPPFLMTNRCNCHTENLDIILVNDEPIFIKVFFPFSMEDSDRSSERFSGCIKIQYAEHKQIDKIACEAEVNFPHVMFIPNDITLYCVSGYSTEETIRMINDSPLTVYYKIKLIKESFVYQPLHPVSEGEPEAFEYESNCDDKTPTSIQFSKDDNISSEKGLVKHEIKPCFCGDDYSEWCLIDLCECAEAKSESSSEVQMEIPTIDLIDKFFQITPNEGKMMPCSEQNIMVTFNGLECVKISIQVVCEVGGGKDQFFNITAIADTVRCEIEDYTLDYGLQLFCEPSVTFLKVINQCMIPLEWCLEPSSDLLKIVDAPRMFNAMEDSFISIERQVSAPGVYNEKLFLEVMQLQPFIIHVKWLATIPQINLNIPRNDAFVNYPVEFGYRAVQLIIADFPKEDQTFKKDCLSYGALSYNSDVSFAQYEIMQLNDKNWHIINQGEKYPSQTDIDMALERLLVIDYINSSKDVYMSYNSNDKMAVSDLLVPGYVISMDPVVVGQVSYLFLNIQNYGYEKAKIKLKREETKRKSPKSCFHVQLEKNTEICQCENSYLNVTLYAKKEIFLRKTVDVNCKLYLQVKHGLTIPVTIKATVVYPCITVSDEILDFDKVFVGQCREMSLLLKNSCPVDCHWKIIIENPMKNSIKIIDNPFHVQYTNDILAPGQECILKVYFKPYKNGSQTRNLAIVVEDAQDVNTVRLVGYGVECKLNFSRTRIEFVPVIPNTEKARETFTIKNNNTYPVEMYWHHLANFTESNRIVRILKHYYRNDDIFIPERQIGDNVPQILLDFYNDLIVEMHKDEDFKQLINSSVSSLVQDDSKSEMLKKSARSHSNREISNQIQSSIPSIFSNFNENKIEALVHAYIAKLQDCANFTEKMNDPLSKLLSSHETLISKTAIDLWSKSSVEPYKKLIFIFYGAPFTEYQETACRVARILNMPVLNLNQIFLEALSISEAESTAKLTLQLDKSYNDLLSKLMKFSTSAKSNVSEEIFDFLKRLPPPEEIERMNGYDLKEYKLETIINILKLNGTKNLLGSPRGKDRGNVKSQDGKQNVFAAISPDIFKDILKERLSQIQFEYGFVLQTLNNDFITNESIALKTLLEAAGKDESYYFITYYNSVELFESRLRNLDQLIVDENIEEKINKIDENVEEGLEEKDHSEEIEKVSQAMKEYHTNLSKLIATIIEWETGKPLTELVNKKGKKAKRRTSSTLKIESKLLLPEKVMVLHIRSSDPWERNIYDSTLLLLSSIFNARPNVSRSISEESSIALPESRIYSIFKEYETLADPSMTNGIFTLSPQDPANKSSKTTNLEPSFASSRRYEPRFAQEAQRTNASSSSPELPIIPGEPISSTSTEARWLLQPGESRSFLVEFRPSDEGRFRSELFLSTMGNADSTSKVSFEGTAAVPRIDLTPASVFDRVKNNKIHDPQEPTFFLNSNILDFGNVLILDKQERILKKSTQLKLAVTSVVPASIILSLTGETRDCFDINPTELIINPGETEIVDVTLSATKIGYNSVSLILTTEHNDQPETIQFEFCGVELNVDFEPKEVKLGRLLLHRTEEVILNLRNNSEIALYWRLLIDVAASSIRITPSQGKMKNKSDREIELHYYANAISEEDKNFISLEVFLDEEYIEPLANYIIPFSATIYEIKFALNFENPIDFKSVPIGTTISESFTLRNLGAYDIKYEVQQQEAEELKKICDANTLRILEEDFQIQPLAGQIIPKKQITISLTYTPSTEITLKCAPLLKCLIIEPHKDIGIVEEHTINISTISYYTRFSIQPYPKMKFGTLALKATKAMQLKIQNTGKYSLQYSINNESMLNLSNLNGADKKDVVPSVGKSSKRLSKTDKNLIKRSTSNTQNVFAKWGPFYVEKIRGQLDPGQIETISIRCSADVIGHFKEKIAILVPYCLPAHGERRSISLVAQVCVAEMVFTNYNELFTESHIVESLDLLENQNKYEEHTIFSKDTKCLHFRCVCVGSAHTTYITLWNPSPVNADVKLEISDDQSIHNAFTVSIDRLSIPAMTKQNFGITFSPNFLSTFEGSLTMTLDLPTPSEGPNFSINLSGESCVPQICIVDPDCDNPTINFGLCLVTETCDRTAAIKNIGQVLTKIRIEVVHDVESAYKIYLDLAKDKLKCGCLNETNATDAKNSTLWLYPKEVANINIQFLPKEVKKYTGRLEIVADKNPYDLLELSLAGAGFTKSVVLENLEIIDTFSANEAKQTSSRESLRKYSRRSSLKKIFSPTSSNTTLLNSVTLTYNLEYDTCYLNRMSRINFKIVNKTTDKYFRFVWNSHSNVLCIPSAGHLAPNSFKELTATFLTSKPILLIQVPLECTINEIILNEPITEPMWDSRQTKVFWTKTYSCFGEDLEDFEEDDVFVKKVIKETVEPEFQIISEALETLQLLISAIADYSNYTCSIDSINFDDTLMFQTKDYKFTLENIGKVNLDFLWSLSMDEQYPLRMDGVVSKSDMSMRSNIVIRERWNMNSTQLNDKLICDEQNKRVLLSKSEDYAESCQSTDLFSSSAALTDRSTDSWIEGENWPFTISPESGTLLPKETIECTLQFAPIDVFEYKAYLKCQMENLNPDLSPPVIVITAKSLLPYCHFEIEESDYVTSGRRNSELPAPSGYSFTDNEINKRIRVVEFLMMGVGECHTRHIHLVNPTSQDYLYHWSRLLNEKLENMPPINCLVETGLVEKGRRSKITFTFVPESVGFFESFWRFEIKKYNLKAAFLIVANVTQPSVSCINTLLKLDSSTIGEMCSSSFGLVNNEGCPLSFNIKPSSLFSEGKYQTLKVSPMAGVLHPNLNLMFNVEYKPSLVGEHTFNIECQIEKLSKPIQVTIKSNVVEILSEVIYIDAEEQETNIIKNRDNLINLGQLMIRESVQLKFKILNIGQISFDYVWILNSNHQNTYKLSSYQSEGTVHSGSHGISTLETIALEKVNIQNYAFALKIKNGPIYRMKLNACAKKAPLEFSFSYYDFGPCYVQTQVGYFYSVDLLIMNLQKISCEVKCEFENKQHIKVDLHQLTQGISPNTQIKISIYFQPTEEIFYREVLHFFTSDCSIKKDIIIKGEGIPYKIRLKNPCNAVVDFGTVIVGKSLCRKIRIINDGRLTASININIIETSLNGVPKNHLSECIADKDSSTKSISMSTKSNELQSVSQTTSVLDINEFLNFSPLGIQDLKPNKELEISLKFKAARRIKLFKAKLGLEVDSSFFPLTVIKANCTMASFCLNRSYISFGTIFEGCEATEKLVLINNGDIGSRFTWHTDKMSPYLKIRPINGYCSADSEIIFNCIFEPSSEISYFHEEIVLMLEEHKDLIVSLSGNCCSLPETRDVIDFKTQLRCSQTKELEIFNDSEQTWRLKPVIMGDYFNVPSSLIVEPKSVKQYGVTYKPQKETITHSFHEGKLVIILPEGRQPILHSLKGRTQSVDLKKIVREIPAKKKFTETLVLCNNSNEIRTFDCTVDLIDGIEGNSQTFREDVPAKGQMIHEFPFYFESEGRLCYKITFDDHGENYQCYDIEFTVTSPEIKEVIELATHVRSLVSHTLKIENPLERESVVFSANSSNEDIIIHGLPMLLAPLAFSNIQIQYLPLVPCDKKETLILSSEIVGSIFYELRLAAKSAPPEKPINVKCSLGGSINFTFKLKNYTKYPSKFNVEISEPALRCPEAVEVPSDEEKLIASRFEPYSLKPVNALIKATSDTAGEFVIPVVGLCTLPSPQGPFVITPNSPALIKFTNAFREKTEFQFSVDNPIFKLKSIKASIASKESFVILISKQDIRASRILTRTKKVGKLTVSPTNQNSSEVKWIYYLRSEDDQ